MGQLRLRASKLQLSLMAISLLGSIIEHSNPAKPEVPGLRGSLQYSR